MKIVTHLHENKNHISATCAAALLPGNKPNVVRNFSGRRKDFHFCATFQFLVHSFFHQEALEFHPPTDAYNLIMGRV